jgi:predicted nuclease of predicted toxin-antitoxin system
MPVMSKKKQPFIIDENLSAALKAFLPADSRTTVECGLKKGTKDYPWIMELCQREEAMLVTADIGFGKHVARYQREHNACCWGLLLLPDNEGKQIELLKRLKEGKMKLKHPIGDDFHFDVARHENLCINLRANPPEVTELCDCEWEDED